jgi:hypothetical protein
MTTETEQPAGRTVERKLRQAWRRQRRFHTTRGLCLLALWAAALVLADFLIDWLFLLPGYGRTILLAINVAALAAVFYRGWWRHLERYDPVRIALQVERKHPNLKSILVSYVQFGSAAPAGGNMSPELIQAVRRLAAIATAPLDFRQIVHWRDLARVAAFSACVVCACGALSFNWPEFFSTLFYRLINPAASTGYPTRTRIEAVTGSLTVPQGTAVALEARCSGLVPASGTLMIRPQQGAWERLVMPAAEGQKFAYKFDQALRTFFYRVRLGDATSEIFEVRVVPPPHVVRTRARLHFPAYTKLPDKEVDTLQLEVPEGTEVALELGCDKPLQAAAVVQEGGPATPMRLDTGGRAARMTWTVKESFPFHFRWTERDHGFVYDGDVTYFIRVVPDMPPDIELVAPAEDDKATVEKKLAIHYRAADDYSIAQAAIVYTLNGGAEQRKPIGTFDKASLEEQLAWPLKETLAGLKEGDTLVVAVEVTDNRAAEAGPNVSRSRPVRLDIVSVAEYLRYVFEKRERLMREVRALHEEETGASKEVKTLKEEPIDVPKPR